MNGQSEYERVFKSKNNIKKYDRKFYIIKIWKSNQRKNKYQSVHDYFKKKYSNHNKLKIEKNERIKERDDKYINI